MHKGERETNETAPFGQLSRLIAQAPRWKKIRGRIEIRSAHGVKRPPAIKLRTERKARELLRTAGDRKKVAARNLYQPSASVKRNLPDGSAPASAPNQITNW
jgi:hypothetical protein